MPGFDRTGPRGQGPLTGRGLGNCGGGSAPRGALINRGLRGSGQGMGRGFWGRGFGWRRMQSIPDNDPRTEYENVSLSREEEKKILEAELKDIELEKQAVEKKLQELQG